MTRPVHFEIHADEPERAVKFYTEVFGWTFTRWGEAEPSYWLISTGPDEDRGINGGLLKRIGPPPEDMQPVSSFVITIDIDNLENYAKSVKSEGGRQVVEKMPIPGVGWLAYFKDTEGNIFGLMQPDESAE
jgi:predicted enzyme related to lactoylglutathione lyase